MTSCTCSPDGCANLCVRLVAASNGHDHHVLAHRACAEQRGIPVLYEPLYRPTVPEHVL
jgi:hypothetical protein